MPRFRTLPLLICLSFALAAAALSGVSALRKISSFQPVGVELAATPGAPVAVRAATPGTGVRAGDRILLLEGTAMPEVSDIAHRLRQSPASRLTVARGDEVVEVEYHRPPLAI